MNSYSPGAAAVRDHVSRGCVRVLPSRQSRHRRTRRGPHPSRVSPDRLLIHNDSASAEHLSARTLPPDVLQHERSFLGQMDPFSISHIRTGHEIFFHGVTEPSFSLIVIARSPAIQSMPMRSQRPSVCHTQNPYKN